MDKLIVAITDWPVLVQALLGSALFSFLVFVGQKVTRVASVRIAQISLRSRRAKIFNDLLRHRAFSTGGDFQAGAAFATALVFRATRPFLKGCVWLAMGFIFESALGVLGIVGFLGFIFYMFATYNIVGPMEPPQDLPGRIADLKRQLDEIDAKLG
jgi:hypothetical protein